MWNMAGEASANGDFDEPFTLITSSAEKLGSAAASSSAGGGLMGTFKAGKEWISNKHSGVQPWAEFLDVRRISKPKNVGDVTSRILGNLQRYQSNYLFVFLGLVIYCIVTNPTLIFALVFCFAVWWFIAVKNKSENIAILGRETSPKELYALTVLIAVPLFYFGGAGSAVFWIIGASVVLILVHAGLMAPASINQTVDAELGIVMEDVTVS